MFESCGGGSLGTVGELVARTRPFGVGTGRSEEIFDDCMAVGRNEMGGKAHSALNCDSR